MLSQKEINLAFRVLDANYNRAVEGLRAVEEYFRFIASNAKITSEIKNLRHRIAACCSEYIDDWASQRNSGEDIGAAISAPDEYSRQSFSSIVSANLARVNQALRAMEEYAKAACPELSPGIESIRYEFYEVEKVSKRAGLVVKTLGEKNVYVLTSACSTAEDFEKRVEALCKAGADVIQLREKNVDDAVLLERARIAANSCSNTDTLFIVNDRPDIALLSGADGVHVGQEEIPIADLRRMLPAKMLVGVSTHSLDQALKAESEGADYIGVGPTFPSKTKCFSEFMGPELLKAVAENVSVPAYAIGGINMSNLEKVVEAGIHRVAVSNVIHSAEDSGKIIQSIKDILVGPNEN